MTSLKSPKGMKNPVMVVGKWEERIPKPNAGTTSIDIKKSTDPEEKEVLKGMKLVPQAKKK